MTTKLDNLKKRYKKRFHEQQGDEDYFRNKSIKKSKKRAKDFECFLDEIETLEK